jgi:hypothetical protein
VAWNAPADWANLEVVTHTKLNAQLRDNMKELWHQIAYTEFTGNVSSTTTVADVVSSGAITYSAFPIIIEFSSPAVDPGANQTLSLSLWDGVIDLGIIAQISTPTNASSGASSSVYESRQLTPSAASHTYKVRTTNSAGTGTVKAGAGGAGVLMPGFIRIWQRGG